MNFELGTCGISDSATIKMEPDYYFSQTGRQAIAMGAPSARMYFEHHQSVCNSSSTSPPVVKRKRRKLGAEVAQMQSGLVCAVCGAKAAGYNFDVISCESCKAFFRRNALRAPSDPKLRLCRDSGNCTVLGRLRKRCPACRLRKCLNVGMKTELITPLEKLVHRSNFRGNRHIPVDVHTPGGVSYTDNDGPSTSYHYYTPPPQSPDKPTTVSSNDIEPSSAAAAIIDIRHSSCESHSSMKSNNQVERQSSTTNKSAASSDSNADSPYAMMVGDSTGSSPTTLHISNPSSLIDSPVATGSVKTETKVHRLSDASNEILSFVRSSLDSFHSPYNEEEWMHCYGPEPDALPCDLEKSFNQMEAGVRKVIRALKGLPFFSLLNKELQICLFKANIQGLLFFFGVLSFDANEQALRVTAREKNGQLRDIVMPFHEYIQQGLRSINLTQWSSDNSVGASMNPDKLSQLLKLNQLLFNKILQVTGSDKHILTSLLFIKAFHGAERFLNEPNFQQQAWLVGRARRELAAFVQEYSLQQGLVPERVLSIFEMIKPVEAAGEALSSLVKVQTLNPLMQELLQRPSTSTATGQIS